MFFENEATDYLAAGDFNPTTQNVSLNKGSLFVDTSDGTLWQKQDSGPSMNFTQVGAAGGSVNQHLSNLLSPTAINQDLIFNKASAIISSKHNEDLTIQLDSSTTLTNLTIDTQVGGLRVNFGNGFIISGPGVTIQHQDASAPGQLQINGGGAPGTGGVIILGGVTSNSTKIKSPDSAYVGTWAWASNPFAGGDGYFITSNTGNMSVISVDAAPYTAAVPADWSGSAPTTIKDALDRIAAALGPIA